MATANDLLDRAIEETKYLHTNEIFLVRDLFKGYEWNRISRSDRLLLGTLFLNYVHTSGTHLKPMAVTKKIEIDGQMVEFRASAAVPRLYRIKFGRDIYKDLRSLEKSVGDNDEESSSLDLFSLEMFENIAYIMAKHAHPDQVPDTPDEWLENFNTFSIYQILPQLIELWGLNVQTEVEARKNLAKVSG